VFYTNNAILAFPAVTLATLPNPVLTPGARAMINDSSSPASGNFGVTAVGGGGNVVPVFSDGANWVLG
jgi:hypothetical protein